MSDDRSTLERELERLSPSRIPFERLVRRRDRKRRNQRIAAGVVGIAAFVAAVWVVAGGLLDQTQTPAVPGVGTGPAETGPAETGPTETGPTETGLTETDPTETRQGPLTLPVSVTDYLVDLETGATTPLPESIVGTEDVTSGYAVSPDGSRLAYVRRGDGKGQVFVANLDGTGIEQVSHDLEAASSPSWSPDGSKIAYVGHQADVPDYVFVLDLATGVSTQVTDDPGAQSPTFSPDGSSILYNVWRGDVGEVRIAPVAGGESERLVGGDSSAGGPRLSPDGSLLSYSCGYDYPYDLCLANADGTDARVLVTGDAPGSWSPDGTRIAYWRSRYWASTTSGVYVVDVATGEVTEVAEGALPTWLDGHTLIVEADGCSLPPDGRCGF